MKLVASILLACLTVAAQRPPQPPAGRMAPRNFTSQPEMKPGKGSIEGTVTNSITHEPVKKATVNLFGMSARFTAVTDEAGRFAFRQLPNGVFSLNATSSQYPMQPGGMQRPIEVTLNDEQTKTGIDLVLTPGGTVSGRVVDEEGSPMFGCNVSAMDVDTTRGARRLMMRSGSNTDDRGEYHLNNVPKGKYYVVARCFSTVPLPHAFIRRGPDTEIPTLAYSPQFYPGVPDLSSAMKVSVAPGSDLTGIDFKMSPAAGITVRGRVGVPEADMPNRFVQVQLVPKDSSLAQVMTKPAIMNRQTGTFRIEHVMPGSYQLTAVSRTGRGEQGSFTARFPLEIGNTEPPPVELQLQPAMSVKGAVQIDGSDANTTTAERARVMLQPQDEEGYMPPPQAQVAKDGSFTLQNVSPGKYKVTVNGAPGFVKAVAIADREISGDVIDFSNGVSGPLKIVIGTKWAQLTGSIANLPSDAAQVNGMIWDADGEGVFGPGNRMFAVQSGGQFTVPGLPPGKYFACAMPRPDLWSLMRNGAVLDALKTRCTNVELKEGETANAQIAFIPAADVERIIQESDR